jgi:hypothetical protein
MGASIFGVTIGVGGLLLGCVGIVYRARLRATATPLVLMMAAGGLQIYSASSAPERRPLLSSLASQGAMMSTLLFAASYRRNSSKTGVDTDHPSPSP